MECVRIRGLTRENAVSAERLEALGITSESWASDIQSGELPGFVCMAGSEMAGYCFGSSSTGEVIVLALQPAYEGRGVGRKLLDLVVSQLRSFGHSRLFLGCSSDPAVRSYGFYRHLGWQSTGEFDDRGDEVLELINL
jgi:GNAT superfamily N-acetyltransferase